MPRGNGGASKRKRGSGPRLNDLQRLEIIRRRQTASPPVSLRQLAREFGVDEKTIRRVVASSADIEARATSAALGRRHSAFRRPSPRFPALEKALVAWIDARQRARTEISPSVVIDKAKLVARAMGISPEDFKASWGWYDKFCRRYGVRTAFVGAVKEDGDGRRETRSLAELHARMEQFDPEWVFTVDETTLFYDTLPFDMNAAAVESGEDARTRLEGVEDDEDRGQDQTAAAEMRNRVTLVVCCNSTGRLAPPICMVGKDEWPPENESNTRPNFPLPYLTQPRAWLDRATFGRWFDTVFLSFVRERTSKPVLLVVDGARPGHQGDFEQNGVQAVFLPPPPQLMRSSPDFTSSPMAVMNPKAWWTKPLEMGVLPSLKARYKYLLVRSALSFHEAPEEVKAALRRAETSDGRNGSGVHFGHAATLLDAARLLVQAWSKVPVDLLENCFARANLVPPSKLLVAPSLPTPLEVFQERVDAAKRHEEDIIADIEKMLISSSLSDRSWSVRENMTAPTLRDRVRSFLHLDAENSPEFQRQLHEEISDALGEVASSPPSMSISSPALTISSVGTADSPCSDQDAGTDTVVAGVELTVQVRELLLSITDVASRLRLLPQAGVGADKLASLQLECCITAADHIRQCIQAFDSNLRPDQLSVREGQNPSVKNGEEATTKESEAEAATDRTKAGEIALV